jgi:hypothetical protein
VKGTREIVVRRNYVMVHAIPQGDFLRGVEGDTITTLRVLHTVRQWR